MWYFHHWPCSLSCLSVPSATGKAHSQFLCCTRIWERGAPGMIFEFRHELTRWLSSSWLLLSALFFFFFFPQLPTLWDPSTSNIPLTSSSPPWETLASYGLLTISFTWPSSSRQPVICLWLGWSCCKSADCSHTLWASRFLHCPEMFKLFKIVLGLNNIALTALFNTLNDNVLCLLLDTEREC